MSHDHSMHNHNHGSHSMGESTATTAASIMDHNNHTGMMDTENSGQSEGHHMMMNMFFHCGVEETILFKFWKISTTGGMIASMTAVFFLAFVYEALKFYREHLYRHSFHTVQVNSVSVPVENGGTVKETHKTVQIASTSTSNNPYAPQVNSVFISQGSCSCPTPDPEEKQENVGNNNSPQVPTTCRGPDQSAVSIEIASSPRSLHYKVKMLSGMHVWQTCLHVIQVVLSYFLMLIFMTYNVWLCIAVAVGAGAGYFFFGWKKSLVVDITEHCH